LSGGKREERSKKEDREGGKKFGGAREDGEGELSVWNRNGGVS
jgi:hypothetical protein